MFQHLHTFKCYCSLCMDNIPCSVAELSIGCIPNQYPLSKSLPFTNGVYLGQVEASVSVGNLYNYITQLPNLLSKKKRKRYFFWTKRVGQGHSLVATVFGRSPYLHDNVSENNSPTSLLGLPSWLRRCHQEIKSHPGWWNWHHLLSRPKNLDLSNQKFLPLPKNALSVIQRMLINTYFHY